MIACRRTRIKKHFRLACANFARATRFVRDVEIFNGGSLEHFLFRFFFYAWFSFCIQLFSTEHRFNQSEKDQMSHNAKNHVSPCRWVMNHLAIPMACTYAHTLDLGRSHTCARYGTVKNATKQWQNIYIKFNWISQTIQELPILKIAKQNISFDCFGDPLTVFLFFYFFFWFLHLEHSTHIPIVLRSNTSWMTQKKIKWAT